jgi:hypothetical protein
MYSPCGSPTNASMHGGMAPMMMVDAQGQQMPMMMMPMMPQQMGMPMMPQNMVCDSPNHSMQGSPTHKDGKDDTRSPGQQSTQPGSPFSGSMASPMSMTPFGSPMQDPHMSAFGGLFTMPVDKMGESMMPGMMMVPMFVDPTHQFEPPQRFGSADFGGANSNVTGGNFKVTGKSTMGSMGSMATASGDPSLESSGSDADSQTGKTFQSQYLWTETPAEELKGM